MNRILKLHKKFNAYPFGQIFFSKFVARMAPYFTTINPIIEEIRSGYIEVSMKKRRRVENHIKTVHAIAMCNLCEFAGGIVTEATIPKHKRWIPIGMEVAYLKKAKTNLTAICDIGNVDWDNIDVLPCFVSVRDTANVEVVTATISMKISDKKVKNK